MEIPMIHAAFDTLDYANTLKAVGVAPKVAETHAELQAKVTKDLTHHLATKADLMAVKTELKADLKTGLANLELKLVTKLGGMMVGGFVVLGVLVTIIR